MNVPGAARDAIFTMEGRTALVVGGAGELGSGIADLLRELGAEVVTADIDGLPSPGVHHIVDVTSTQSCRDLVRDVTEFHGPLHAVVNCAGIMVRKAIVDTTDDEWDRVIDVNLSGAFRVARAAFPGMSRTRQNASLVNIASTLGLLAASNVGAYAVSKAGLLHLTRVLAYEWAAAGVRVNAIAPSIVPTRMNAAIRTDSAYMHNKLEAIPLGRMVGVTDVAWAAAYLVSAASAMVTGQTVVIDGGETIH